MSLLTSTTNAQVVVIKKGESAPFTGALLPEWRMREAVDDHSFREKIEPALAQTIEKPQGASFLDKLIWFTIGAGTFAILEKLK